MHAYIYAADIYCVTCGEKLCDDIVPSEGCDPDDESSYDSSEYPKGPYPDGGGEADTPQHCAECGEFLGNPLTAKGYVYVMDRVAAERDAGDISETTQEWWNFYGTGMLGDDEPDEDADDEELDSCDEEFGLNEHWDHLNHLSDLLDDDKAF